MTLISFKWAAASIIFAISMSAGFTSLRIAAKYQKQIQIGNAVANGIFIGAAIFHMFPNAVDMFRAASIHSAILFTIAVIISSFLLLTLIDRSLRKLSQTTNLLLGALLVTITLAIHAFIGGIALGISEIVSIASIILFAIIIHKGFEVFALVMSLHQRISNTRVIMLIFLLFSLITPLGIWAGIICDHIFHQRVDSELTAVFNAFAAGTFLYIGTLDRHESKPKIMLDGYQQYSRVLATFAGIACMALVGIWV